MARCKNLVFKVGLLHCKLKPCKAYRKLPVSQFSPGSHCRDPVFITGISLLNPVLLGTELQCDHSNLSDFVLQLIMISLVENFLLKLFFDHFSF